jgi:hypothetical protein
MKLTPEKLTAFCAALAETCNVGKACTAVGVSRYTAYKWRKDMPDFAEAWDDAMKAGLLALEDEAHRRAFEGVEDPLTHQGQFTYLWRDKLDEDGEVMRDDNGMPLREPVLDANGEQKVAAVRKYSDTLAIFLLKAHNPDKYRENSKVELSGRLSVNEMSEEDMRAELAALVATGVVPTATDDCSDLV